MAAVDLIFSRAAGGSASPVALVFGETDAPSVPVYTLGGSGTVTGLRLQLAVRSAVRLSAAGRVSGLHLRCALGYDVNVARPTVAQASARWQDAVARPVAVQARYLQALPQRWSRQTRWQDAQRRQSELTGRWQTTQALRQAAALHDQQALALDALAARSMWQESLQLRDQVAGGWQEALRLAGRPAAQRYQEAAPRRDARAQRFQPARPAQAFLIGAAGYGLPVRLVWHGRYQEAWPPRPGRWVRPPLPGMPPCYVPALPAALVFSEVAAGALPAALVFVCERTAPPPPGAVIVVPIRRVYMTVNSITLHRVDTGAELHAHAFSMSLDYQSWTWSWTASLHSDAANHLGRDSAGDPAELAVFVNGVEFRLRLEGRSRDRRFSPTRWSVSGKGKASVLGSADAPRQSFRNLVDRTAQQLMADVLTVNGVPMGWTVDWGLEDWLVPAGAWAIQGNYIDAINDIAGAAGGYVQPHNTAATLRVLPRYPLAPWAWGGVTPDFEIPADAAEVEGTEFIDKPVYNRVFVGGIGEGGVFGPFTRAGTAGNVIAPQVAHALITHPVAHRQRGIAELSDTGKQERITLTMQVLPETGVIVPGQFVRYLGGSTVMGIVRSTSIGWSRPRLRQTLEIEVHA